MGNVGAIARRLFASVFVSVLLAALLSMLPLLEQMETQEEVPAFGSHRPIRLTSENLVDFLLAEEARWDWKRVDWNGKRLEWDASWNGTNEDILIEDLYHLTQSAFVVTSNVQEIDASFHLEGTDQHLVFRASRRQLGEDTHMENPSGLSPRQYLEQRFYLTIADRNR
jgi:hypothetical protein